MPYPTDLDVFTTKVDYVDLVMAAHVNNLQASVVAIETAIGTSPTTINAATTPDGTLANVAEYLDDVATLIKGIVGGANYYSAIPISLTTLNGRQIIAGAGLTGGGTLAADRTIALSTPGTLTVSSANSATAPHTHAVTSSSNPGANASLLASSGSGGLTLASLTTGSGGITMAAASSLGGAGALTINPLGAMAVSPSGTLTLSPTGDVSVNPGSDVMAPTTNYGASLGTSGRRWSAIYAGDLFVGNLIRFDTSVVMNGRLLIGSSSTLIADCAAAATTIDVAGNPFIANDIVYMEMDSKVEFMQITSAATTITNGYRYSVTRNYGGALTAQDWFIGDVVFNTGQTGTGFIELYAYNGILSSQVGPTILVNVRESSTYNGWDSRVAIGNLAGTFGITANQYGIGLGDFSSGNYTLYDGSSFAIHSGDDAIVMNEDGISISVPGTSYVAKSTYRILRGDTDTYYGGLTGYYRTGAYPLNVLLLTTEEFTGIASQIYLDAKSKDQTAVITLDASASDYPTLNAVLMVDGGKGAVQVTQGSLDALSGINVGTATGAGTGEVIGTYSTNAALRWEINNANTGSSASAGLSVTSDVVTASFSAFSDASGERLNVTANGGYILFGTTSDHPIIFYGNNAEVARLTSAGVVQFGSSQDTNLYRSAASVLSTDDSFSAVTLGRVVTLRSGEVNVKASSGGWATGFSFTGSGDTALGGFFGYGSSDALTYLYVGTLAGYTTPWVKFESSGKVTIGKAMITPEGGYAILCTANAAITQYDIVQFGGASERVIQAAGDSDLPAGVAYTAAAGSGSTLWVVVAGFCEVNFKSGVTPTFGYVAYMSDTAGKADNSASLPAVATHNREIGHVYKTGSSGGTTTVMLHWN